MKWLIFQLHWLLGITLGVVLACVGVSGALMAFEDEIMDALSHGVVDVAPRSIQPLTPDQLIAKFQAQRPGAVLNRITLQPPPGGSARVVFEPAKGEPTGAHGTDRTYLDPYTGRILGKATGETFFENVRLFHRYLLIPGEAEGAGRHITGAAAFSLIFFALSGLYLRWPRRALDWKAWLKPDLSRRGRNLYWSLHSVIGTWVLPIYLVMALTGLTWSYQWYEDATTALLTGKPVAAAKPAAKAKKPAVAETPSLDLAWRTFQQREPAGATQVIIPIPASAKAPVKLRYLYPDAPHYRAVNEMTVDGRTGAVIKSTHYATDPLGEQIVAGMLSIHRGSAFGLAGAVVFMAAALFMPLFPTTGWLLYLDRRRKKAEARALAAATGEAPAHGDGVLIAYASQAGVAERLAWQSARALVEGGRPATVKPLGSLSAEALREAGTLIVVASTYGAGEPPDPARAFARKVMAAPAALEGLRYGVLALGHSDYPDFCGFGRTLDRWLCDSGADPLFPRIEMDGEDQAAALDLWRARLAELGAGQVSDAFAAAPASPWVLTERRLLNPGSPGGEAWHVALEPREKDQLAWTAGDVAEVSPRLPAHLVTAFLRVRGLDGAAKVTFQGGETMLRDALARSHLPEPPDSMGLDEAGLAAILRPLPRREYSIASLPSDGRLELLVRKTVLPDGRLGLGSGWLTAHAPVGGEVELRIRPNPRFHPPKTSGPMILIGAGTGMAGLRAHVRHRRLRGQRDAWMFFGERSAATDRLHGDEVDAWLAEGTLARADWAFSRDGARRYVQDLVGRQSECLRRHVLAHDAAIYVCGGVEMAAGVHEALASTLGEDGLERLVAEGRYQRDVY
jgi:sulfite reductase (NADPH) flavoprotein alpha-component